MNKLYKGDYGYINSYKKKKLIGALILLLMIVFIVVTVRIMFGDTKRVAIVFAILLSLPFAKVFIAFFVVKGFKSMDKKDYGEISEALVDDLIAYDVTLSRYEGMRYYYCLCVKNGFVYAYVPAKDFSSKKKDYTEWIKQSINDGKYEYKVACFDNVGSFIKKVNQAGAPSDNTLLVDKYIMKQLLDMGV